MATRRKNVIAHRSSPATPARFISERNALSISCGEETLVLGVAKQDDVITRNGKSAAAGGLAHHTLRTVAHDSTTEPFSTNEGDPSGVAFANRFTYGHSNQRVIETTPLTEHMLEILPRLNSLHARCVYRC